MDQETTKKLEEAVISNLSDILRQFPSTHSPQHHKDASVYIGLAGIAHLFYFLYTLRPNFHMHNKDFITYAVEYANAAAFGLPREVPRDEEDRVGFLCTPVGIHAACAVVFFHANQLQCCSDHLKWIVSCSPISQSPSIPSELLYGRAGYLYALLFLRKHISVDICHQYGLDDDLIRNTVNAIISVGQQTQKTATFSFSREHVPWMWKWHGKMYLGAAHGIAGILSTLMVSGHEFLDDYEEDLASMLQWITNDLPMNTSLGLNWPSSLQDSGHPGRIDLIQWCHGAPGLFYLSQGR